MNSDMKKPVQEQTEQAIENSDTPTTVTSPGIPVKSNFGVSLSYIGMLIDARRDATQYAIREESDPEINGVTLVAYERNKDGAPRQRYVSPEDMACEDNRELVAAWLEARDAEKYNLYVQINHARPNKNGVKAAKADIDRVDWVHVDIDVPSALGKEPAPDGHHARYMATIESMLAQGFLKAQGFPGDMDADGNRTDDPLPSFIVNTGNGYQLLWRLAHPIHTWDNHQDVQSGDAIEKCECVNRAAAKAFALDGVTGDHCHNVDRVLRLPGSVNYPSDDKIARKGSAQGGILVELVHDAVNRQFGFGTFPREPEELVLGEDRVHAQGEAPPASTPMAELKRSQAKRGWACTVESEDYPDFPNAFMEKYPGFERLAERILMGTNEIDPPASTGNRSGVMYGCCLDLLRMDAEFPPKYIQGFLLNPECVISAHVRDQSKWRPYGSAENYARKQVSDAIFDVEVETLKRAEAEADLAERTANGTAGADEEWIGGAAPAPETGETVLAQGVQRASSLPRSATQSFITARKKVGGVETDVVTQCSFNYALAVLKLGVRMSYDLFAHRELVTGLAGYGPEMGDAAFNALSIAVELTFSLRPKDGDFRKVLNTMATRNSFHPVRDYLDSLKWDGEARIDTWLIKHAGTEDTVLNRAQSRLWLMAAVARIRTPGAKFDQMPILEGEQGIRKTTLVKALVPNEDWFTDTLRLGMDSKVTMEQTGGIWIAEIGELSGMSRKEVGNIKTQLSRTVERARGAFQRYAADARRQFVMIGTTNDEKYLHDDTGGRRFWPMKAYKADVEAVADNRDQLWAEASERLAQGETLLLDPELYAAAAVQQEERRVVDAFEGLLRGFFSKTVFADDADQIGVTTELDGKIITSELWRLLGYPSGAQVKRDEQRRIASAMKILGFKQGQYRFEGKRFCGYCRGTAPVGGELGIFSLDTDEYGRVTGLREPEQKYVAPPAPEPRGERFKESDIYTLNDVANATASAEAKRNGYRNGHAAFVDPKTGIPF